MTIEKAIKLLVNATYSNKWQGNEDLTTANNMAIKALEKFNDNTYDIISKSHLEDYMKIEKAIQILQALWCNYSDTDIRKALDMAIKSLKNSNGIE